MPTGNIIYEGDDFEYEIDAETGRKRILKHKQDFKNIDNNKILGAYATVPLNDGTKHVEIMPMTQIRHAWMQGATKGQSPAHKNFPDQMAIKTVIGRACKLFISTSDDSGLFTKSAEEAEVIVQAKPQQEVKEERKLLDIEDVEHSTVPVEPERKPQEEATAKKKPNF